MQPTYKIFSASEVNLEGANLIEASAGTGKTYSIAILVLRLLLEKQIPIQQILMVTFTKAAVAELQDRVRRFVRTAYHCALAEDSESKRPVDSGIAELVGKHDREEAVRLLKSALIDLDEISVLTIHSFCQQTLNEFAFETGQLFGSELIQDVSSILDQEIQKFWRENITGIETKLLTFLIDQGFDQDTIKQLIREHLAGKGYIFYDPKEVYDFDHEKQKAFYKEISIKKELLDKAEGELTAMIAEQPSQSLIEICSKNRFAKESLLPLVGNFPQFIEALKGKADKLYVQKLFPQEVEKIDQIKAAKSEYDTEVVKCKDYLYAFTIQKVAKSVEERKILASQFSFDDLIGKLHEALMRADNEDLKQGLRKKYEAVFIDEFQDTDRLQFEIFHTVFQMDSDTTLFYIGDPKQSIYSFRTADIATYFRARKSVGENLFTMNENYRSNPRLVEAMNQFFLPQENFDTFYFEGEAEKIEYTKVEGKKKEKETLLITDQPQVPMTVSTAEKLPQILEALAQDVLDLLVNPDVTVYDEDLGSMRRILPSDIGILVRWTKTGLDVKKALNKRGIPAVMTTDEKVLQSSEATDMIYVLEAFLENRRPVLNRALMTSFVGFSSDEIRELNQENAVQLFRKYLSSWNQSGVYTTLLSFAADFEIRQNMILKQVENGERILTNFYHLAEMLHKTELRQHLSPEELIAWLRIKIQNPNNSEDEWEQRIESDEQAVKIATIHKSKGLEYKIVFLPQLDLTKDTKHEVISFRDEGGDYKTGTRNQLSEDQIQRYDQQVEQENRRLIYVAITRAKYKCYLYTVTKVKDSALKTFLKALTPNELLEIKQSSESTPARYHAGEMATQSLLRAKDFHLRENNWRRMSYSGLAGEHERTPKVSYVENSENYDRFIFKDLKKGARTGTFLHYIFEELNFKESNSWPDTIKLALNHLDAMRKDDDLYRQRLLEFVNHVMTATLEAPDLTFTMSEVELTLHELEFDFPVKEFLPKDLEQINEVGIADIYRNKLQGLMNGKIDLFFKMHDKYYVLDWKSNYLGPTLEDYSTENLELAMSENNYHLQYLIYVLAVKKYLKSRLGGSFDFEKQFGGVFYLFVRGMRKGQDSGVFYRQISKEQIVTLERVLDSVLLRTH